MVAQWMPDATSRASLELVVLSSTKSCALRKSSVKYFTVVLRIRSTGELSGHLPMRARTNSERRAQQ